jgi:dTDP-4-dehydrorhamnose reductase
MPNILVTGANGQVGRELSVIAPHYDHTFHFMSKSELDITKPTTIEQLIITTPIDIIINCAAYTAVDKAEREPDIAHHINAIGTQNLAEIAKKHQITLIHLSTDYVFNGTNTTPYRETDPPSPNSIYGHTKRDGETALLKINPPNSIIIRTSWLYSNYGKNFVKTIQRLAKENDSINVVSDQIGCPTYAADLAHLIMTILPKLTNTKAKIYHYANEGQASWYEFAQEIITQSQLNCTVTPIPTSDYPTAAARPPYSVLDTTTIKNTFQVTIPNWKESLKHCLHQYTKTKYNTH